MSELREQREEGGVVSVDFVSIRLHRVDRRPCSPVLLVSRVFFLVGSAPPPSVPHTTGPLGKSFAL